MDEYALFSSKGSMFHSSVQHTDMLKEKKKAKYKKKPLRAHTAILLPEIIMAHFTCFLH